MTFARSVTTSDGSVKAVPSGENNRHNFVRPLDWNKGGVPTVETTEAQIPTPMSETNFAPPETNRTDVRIGLIVKDQRSGDVRQVLYTDSRVVLLRDDADNTTLLPRESFESSLGSRYRPSVEDGDGIDDGQYGSLRDRLAEYEAMDGRKADHKAAALREALDVVSGRDETNSDPAVVASSADGTDNDSADEEVRFDEIPGIGPETDGKLRTQGFVTEADLRSASDDEILAVSGVGPSNLANIRDFLD